MSLNTHSDASCGGAFSGANATIRSSEQGAAMVEFAFAAFAFFLFMIVTLEAGIIGWRVATAQYIASQTVREAAMYAGEEGNLQHYCGRTRARNIVSIIRYAQEVANGMGLDAVDNCSWANNNIQICQLASTEPFLEDQGSCKGVFNEGDAFGGPEDFIAVRIRLPTRFFLQMMDIGVVGWAAARNEEFGN